MSDVKPVHDAFLKNERRTYLTRCDIDDARVHRGMKFDASNFKSGTRSQRAPAPTMPLGRRAPVRLHIVSVGPSEPVHAERCGRRASALNSKPTHVEYDADGGPRPYSELLDRYSLHNVYIHRGRTLSTTPEFLSFRRLHGDRLWHSIAAVLGSLESRMAELGVPLAIADGKKLAHLAASALSEQPSLEELLACVVNVDDLLPYIRHISALRYVGARGPDEAATAIQKTFRMHRARVHVRELLQRASTIQALWAARRRRMRTLQILAQRRAADEAKWRARMDAFCRDWRRFKRGRRLAVHIPSFSVDWHTQASVCELTALQCTQLLARLCDLRDPDTEVLLVSPSGIEDESLQHMLRLLQAAGVHDAAQRLTVVDLSVENCARPFSHEGQTLSRSLFLTTRTLRNIRSMCAAKNAYIVPGLCDVFDARVAFHLQLPVLGPDPSLCHTYATKSGARRVFEAASVNFAPGASDIYDDNDLYLLLARSIVAHPGHVRWMIKIDTEFGGRGLAVVDSARLRCLSHAGLADAVRLRDRVFFELKASMARIVEICCTRAYPNWASFAAAIRRHGAVVEAVADNVVCSPTVNIFVEPGDGASAAAVEVQSMQEQLVSLQYRVCGVLHPLRADCSVVEALRGAACSIGSICGRRRIYGYVSVDFVVFMTQVSRSLAVQLCVVRVCVCACACV